MDRNADPRCHGSREHSTTCQGRVNCSRVSVRNTTRFGGRSNASTRASLVSAALTRTAQNSGGEARRDRSTRGRSGCPSSGCRAQLRSFDERGWATGRSRGTAAVLALPVPSNWLWGRPQAQAVEIVGNYLLICCRARNVAVGPNQPDASLPQGRPDVRIEQRVKLPEQVGSC